MLWCCHHCCRPSVDRMFKLTDPSNFNIDLWYCKQETLRCIDGCFCYLFVESLIFIPFSRHHISVKGSRWEIWFWSDWKPLGQYEPNLAEIILGLSPFKIISDRSELHPSWPPLQKIENSLIGWSCLIWRQNMVKFNH